MIAEIDLNSHKNYEKKYQKNSRKIIGENILTATTMELNKQDMTRALVAIYVASFIAGLAIGAAMPMISISMELRGASAASIGYVVAAAPLGLILASPIIGSVVNRFGLLPSIIMGNLIVSVTLFLMPHFYGVLPWIICRFIAGLGIAVIWILSETWVNSLATDQNRGRIIAGFMILMATGFGLGPIVVTFVGTETWTAFYLAGGVLIISMVPMVLARDVAPTLPKSEGWSFGKAIRTAPLLMVIALFAGVTDSTQMSFYPVYAVREGFAADMALYMLSAIVAGSILVQFPIGMFADRYGRNLALAAFLLLTIVFGGIIPFVLHDPIFIWPILVLWGAVAFGLYTLCIIILGDRFDAASLAGANAALVAIYELGSIAGPVAVGHAMDSFGPDGMPIVLVLSGIPVAIYFVIRRLIKR